MRRLAAALLRAAVPRASADLDACARATARGVSASGLSQGEAAATAPGAAATANDHAASLAAPPSGDAEASSAAPQAAGDAAAPDAGQRAAVAAASGASAAAAGRSFASRVSRSLARRGPVTARQALAEGGDDAAVHTSGRRAQERLDALFAAQQWSDFVTVFETWRAGKLVLDDSGPPVRYKPNAKAFNQYVETRARVAPAERDGSSLDAVLVMMAADGVKPSRGTFSAHASLCFSQEPRNPDMAERLVALAKAHGTGLTVAGHVVSCVALSFRLRVAESLLVAMEADGQLGTDPQHTVRTCATLNTLFQVAVKARNMAVAQRALAGLRLRSADPDAHRLGEMVACGAEQRDAPAAAEALASLAAHPRSPAPLDEGTLTAALDCAARCRSERLESLAWAALTAPRAQAARAGAPPPPPAFAALLASRAARGALDSAFDALAEMEAAHPEAAGEPAALAPLVAACSGGPDQLDAAYYCLEARARRGGAAAAAAAGGPPPPPAVSALQLNAVVAACAAAGDVGRAFETFEAFPLLGAVPNIGTYNALLGGCVWHGRAAAVHQLVAELQAKGLRPDGATTSLLVDAAVGARDTPRALRAAEDGAAAGAPPSRAAARRLLAHAQRHADPAAQARALAVAQSCGMTGVRGEGGARVAARGA